MRKFKTKVIIKVTVNIIVKALIHNLNNFIPKTQFIQKMYHLS
jgi:hypothetical protein